MGGECALLPVPWPGADADGSGPGQTLFFSGNLGRPPQLHFLMDGGEKRLHNQEAIEGRTCALHSMVVMSKLLRWGQPCPLFPSIHRTMRRQVERPPVEVSP